MKYYLLFYLDRPLYFFNFIKLFLIAFLKKIPDITIVKADFKANHFKAN